MVPAQINLQTRKAFFRAAMGRFPRKVVCCIGVSFSSAAKPVAESMRQKLINFLHFVIRNALRSFGFGVSLLTCSRRL